MTGKYICPNCGSKHGLRFLASTSALFVITDDGEIGQVSLSPDSIDCMNEWAACIPGNVEFRCLDCHTTFEAYSDNNNEWQIGNQL